MQLATAHNFDLTRDQLQKGENIVEANVVPDDFLKENMDTMRPDVLARISVMRGKVRQRLGEFSRPYPPICVVTTAGSGSAYMFLLCQAASASWCCWVSVRRVR